MQLTSPQFSSFLPGFITRERCKSLALNLMDEVLDGHQGAVREPNIVNLSIKDQALLAQVIQWAKK